MCICRTVSPKGCQLVTVGDEICTLCCDVTPFSLLFLSSPLCPLVPHSSLVSHFLISALFRVFLLLLHVLCTCFHTSHFSSLIPSSRFLSSPLVSCPILQSDFSLHSSRLAPPLLRPVRKYPVSSYWIGCFVLAALRSPPLGLLGNDNKIEISQYLSVYYLAINTSDSLLL